MGDGIHGPERKLMEILRLSPNDPRSWALWPQFEARVIAMAAESQVPMRIPVASTELRNRFLNLPLTALYLLYVEEDRIVGHCCGWLVINFGMPSLFILQDAVEAGRKPREKWGDAIRLWFDQIESAKGKVAYLPADLPPFRKAQIVTPHDPELAKRYLSVAGFEHVHTRSMMTFEVK
jgi:hypothetical protein